MPGKERTRRPLYFKSLRLRTCDNVRAFYGGAWHKRLRSSHRGAMVAVCCRPVLSLSDFAPAALCCFPTAGGGEEEGKFEGSLTATRKIDCFFVDPRGLDNLCPGRAAIIMFFLPPPPPSSLTDHF